MPQRTAWLRPAVAAALAGAAAYLCLRHDSEWEAVYLPAARLLAAGGNPYDAEGFLYPPFAALAAVPFAALPAAAGRPAWVALNLACLVVLLRGAWRLAGGGARPGRGGLLAAAAGAGCGVFYAFNCLAHQQTDVVLAALLIGGCLALRGSRPLLAATAFGLAAAVKCTPLLWAPYLLWRGRPAAAAWLVAVALGANLLPDLVSRPPAGATWLAEYHARYLRPLTTPGHVVGTWGSEVLYNQSLAGAGQRWLATEWHWSEADCTVVPRPCPLPPLALRGLVYGAGAALLLAAALACGRPFRRPDPAAGGGDVPREALEFSAVLLLMLLLSPMSSVAHFGVLVVPGVCLARLARAPGRRAFAVPVLVSFALALASNKDLLGGKLYTVALWYGCVTWNTLALLAGCLLAQAYGRRAPAASLPSPAEPAPRAA
jgi:hypothetical protein